MRHVPIAAAALAGGVVSFGVGLLVIKAARAALVVALGGAALGSAWLIFVRRRR